MKLLIAICVICTFLSAQEADDPLRVGGDYAAQFEAWLTRQAQNHWDRRNQEIQSLSDGADVLARREYVRSTLIGLMGGVPAEKSPLNARVTGGFTRDGYRVENIIFESQPGFMVTANLYLPTTGQAPYPAVLGTAGHSVNGKAAVTYQSAFIAFARQGFAVLAFDPPGQGERLEYYNAETGRSFVGAGVSEHNMAGLQCLLTGHTLARYLIWDGIRAFDYLLTRPEIDHQRISVAGNSGGGTQASYLAVADPRLAAVVSSCYMTRWRELWSGPGPQDAEQVLPGFIAQGLDFGDFALGFAPGPFLMTTATRDFFPIAGARATFQQTQRLFGLLGDDDRLGYFEYDDTHGWSKPRREAAVRFLAKWLQQRDIDATEVAVQPEEDHLLHATATGQLATSGGSETVQSLNLKIAHHLGVRRGQLDLPGLRSAIGLQDLPGPPSATIIGGHTLKGVRVEKIELTVEGGVQIPALLFQPATDANSGRAVVFVTSFGKGKDAEVFELARGGTVVLAIDPRGMGESYRPAGRTGYSHAYQTVARTLLVGRNLVEMQVSDLLAATHYLQTRPECADRKLSLLAKGSAGPAALMAAALDSRLTAVTLDRSIVSYMDVVESRLHEGLTGTFVPGILARLDLPEVLPLLEDRVVTLISPVRPDGIIMPPAEARRKLGSAAALVTMLYRNDGHTLESRLHNLQTIVGGTSAESCQPETKPHNPAVTIHAPGHHALGNRQRECGQGLLDLVNRNVEPEE